jgi:phage terminase large subunit
MKLTVKQTKALDFLEDQVTSELYYGGAAGGGKSILGTYWILKAALKYEGSRWLMGRSELKNLKKTTLLSFFEVCRLQGLRANVHYRYQEQQSIIYLGNGSQIIMADLFAYPSDPEFDSLGSLEVSGAFIDEAPQITALAKDIVRSRIRYNLKEYCHVCGNRKKAKILELEDDGEPKRWLCGNGHESGGLIPKMLMTGNPSKNWAYYQFYLASKDGTITRDRQFIQALVTDNKYIPKVYIESLRRLNKASRERLLNGNWEYDDDPAALIEYEMILQAFKNDHVPGGAAWLTVDVARFGKDTTTIAIWTGWKVRFERLRGKRTTEVSARIRQLQIQYGIPSTRVIADEDGVGGGVVDETGCIGFVNGSTPIGGEGFNHLKSQCYFKLAERMNRGEIHIMCDDAGEKQLIVQELEQVKQHDMDKDGKRKVLPKDKVKELIGRSPDYSDALMMREYGELVAFNSERFIY